MPNTKLKPLRRDKDSKVNMSVDTRLNDEFDSLIDEDRASSRREGPAGRPKIQRKIIRDTSQQAMQKVGSAKNQLAANQQRISANSKSRPANQRPHTITRQNSNSTAGSVTAKPAPKQFNIRTVNSKGGPRRNSNNNSQLSQRDP